ncbi:tyrosine-type recombinase/integrase [Rhizobium leguminosarum]|uniref:tyrosine-type recombinase/integrase n=1 Tax=Rhizobium leguminosarum TaxID=384 RepID=UPI003F982FA9
MPTETFNGHTLTKIKNIMKKGTETLIQYRDEGSDGLSVKITKTGGNWYFSTRTANRLIAPFGDFGLADVPNLRDLVKKLRAAERLGEDVSTMIEEFKKSGSVILAVNAHNVEHGDGMMWPAARDMYLEWVRKNKEPDTYRSYRSALGCFSLGEDFSHLTEKPVASITTRDLARVRKNITTRCHGGHARGEGNGIRQAELTVSALKGCFKFLVNDPDVDIETNPAESLAKPGEAQVSGKASKDRALTQLEVGAFIWALGGILNETVRLILTIQLLTGQRRMTVVEAMREDFDIDHKHYGVVWKFGDKTHAFRALPLNGQAGQSVLQAMRLSESKSASGHLFPKQRRRRKDDNMSGHINEATVSDAIEQMRSPGGVFELTDFNVSTHDLRKTFETVMTPRMYKFTFDGRQLRGEDVEMITHMNEGRKKVSMLIYDKNQYLDIKAEILAEWEQWCWEGYHLYSQARQSGKAA